MSSEQWTAWLSVDALSFKNRALTKALQMSLSNGNDDSSSPSSPSSSVVEPPAAAAAAAAAGPARDKTCPGPQAAGKIAKRKSRARKRTPTTYIQADPENFRAMVQQMTGVGVGGPLIKPEPKRQSFVPGFLLDPAENNAGSVGAGPVYEEEELLGFDVDAFLSFPTLDSWGF